jgi:hypothetical protein
MANTGWNNQLVGLLVIAAGGGYTGLFIYSPSPGPGNLILSIAAAAGTDPYGNAFPIGLVSYSGNQATQLFQGEITLFTNYHTQVDNSPTIPAPGQIEANPAYEGELDIFSGQAAASEQQATVELFSASSPNPARIGNPVATEIDVFASQIYIAGNVTLVMESAPSTTPYGPLLFGDLAGYYKFISSTGGTVGDGNTWQIGRKSTALTGAQTISSASYTTVSSGQSLSMTVGTGQYHFRFHCMIVDNGAGVAAPSSWKVTAPASTGQLQLVGTANGPLVSVRVDTVSGFGTALSAPTVTPGSGTRHDIVIEGTAVFSAGGTLALQAAIAAAGDAQFIIGPGSSMEVTPIS